MTGIGILGAVGIAVIVILLIGWIYMTVRASRHPMRARKPGGKLKRGRVSGGAIRGDPGQNILTGEAPRQDDEEHKHA